MGWILLCLWLSMLLLFWTYTTTGLRQENTSTLQMLVYSGLMSLGAASVLFCTIVLAAKIFSSIMTQQLDLTLTRFLLEVIKNSSYEPTVTSIGTTL